jgi:hypothetical protein
MCTAKFSPNLVDGGGCRFSSLSAQRAFDGKIQGNYDHQYVVSSDGCILDLNDDAEDVRKSSNPHRRDKRFWNNKDHRESMDSCRPRVEAWINYFEKEISEAEE